MAIGTLVACHNVDQALTLSLGTGQPFACGRARACNQQDCLQPHTCLFTNRRHSDGLGFHIRRSSGRHPNVWVPLVESLFLRQTNTGADGQRLRTHASGVTKLHWSRMLRTTFPTLHRLCCSNLNFWSRAHRWGAAFSFPADITPALHLTCWKQLVLRV